jgi:hypothetical protein
MAPISPAPSALPPHSAKLNAQMRLNKGFTKCATTHRDYDGTERYFVWVSGKFGMTHTESRFGGREQKGELEGFSNFMNHFSKL